jgi:hypothetical protein
MLKVFCNICGTFDLTNLNDHNKTEHIRWCKLRSEKNAKVEKTNAKISSFFRPTEKKSKYFD